MSGRPVEGIAEVKELECAREGMEECVGVSGEGWVSVAIAARYWMTFFVLSVFPAPDSPLFDVRNRKNKVESHARNQNTLVLAFFAHIYPGSFCDGKYMWRILVAALSSILVDNRVRVER